MNPFEWLRQWWKGRQRKFDRAVMWPALKEECQGDIELARMGFGCHMLYDPAYDDWSNEQRENYLKTLV